MTVEQDVIEQDLALEQGDREAYTVSLKITAPEIHQVVVLARDEEHAKELATKLVEARQQTGGSIENIDPFDAYKTAHAEAKMRAMREAVLAKVEEIKETEEYADMVSDAEAEVAANQEPTEDQKLN